MEKAERTIRRKGGTISSGKVISEQSFGFWTSLFETHHYRLIGGVIIHCFPNKPNNVNRSVIAQKLNRIREFRNRVYHNEPICLTAPILTLVRLKIYAMKYLKCFLGLTQIYQRMPSISMELTQKSIR